MGKGRSVKHPDGTLDFHVTPANRAVYGTQKLLIPHIRRNIACSQNASSLTPRHSITNRIIASSNFA